MSDQKQKALYEDLSKVIKNHLEEAYGKADPNDNMPARVAVALLQLSSLYFVTTGAPKAVVTGFVRQVFGADEDKKLLTGADLLKPLLHKA